MPTPVVAMAMGRMAPSSKLMLSGILAVTLSLRRVYCWKAPWSRFWLTMTFAEPVTLSPFFETLDFWANGLDGARDIAAEDVGILVDEGGVVLDFPVDGIGSNGAILD